MSLYEVGDPTADAVDIYSSGSGYMGLTHNSTVDFTNTNLFSRSQSTVVGLVTSPGATPVIYLDGTGHSATSNYTTTVIPASANCSGGYLLAGTGTGIYYGIPLFGVYNFLGFALYSGAVDAATAASVSTTMRARGTPPAYNIVADGDSITQGTGSIYGYNMVHYLEPLLNAPADITDIAIYGTTSPTAVGHATSPTSATSADGTLYNPSCTRNIYYVDIGTNDVHEGATGAATWGFVVQALQAAKAMGYTTIAATLLHEHGETAASGTEVNIYNSLARAAVGQPYLDAIVDYEADARLGNTNNYYPAYSGDGTHPNDAGYQVMSTIAAPIFNRFIGLSYADWSNKYFASNPANGAETAMPMNDGVSNLLKYLFDINPAAPMSASDLAALPSMGMTTLSGSSYLTLSYRQNPSETGLTVNVQISPDLHTWQTVTPNFTLNTGTDPATGDPLIQVQVLLAPGTSQEFLRLNVTGP
jgi:lysophospholipase L1-like esterase